MIYNHHLHFFYTRASYCVYVVFGSSTKYIILKKKRKYVKKKCDIHITYIYNNENRAVRRDFKKWAAYHYTAAARKKTTNTHNNKTSHFF